MRKLSSNEYILGYNVICPTLQMTGVTLFLMFLLNLGILTFSDVARCSGFWQTTRKSNCSADTDVDFESFRKQFHRNYKLHSDCYHRRRSYFKNSIKRHAYLNSLSTDKDSAKYGINQFSDLSINEFRGLKTEGLPATFDWRDQSAVGSVQNQQATRVKLVKQAEYPYKAETGICHLFSQSHDGVLVKDFAAHDFSGLEEAMMGRLVEWGPLAVTVDAISWQDYLGGIMQHHCSCHHANHAVLVTGYDTTGDVPYWIVQNSWGTSWGNKGYVYIKMGDNVCGIADSVTAVFL
ncbi:cathepsin O isoform X4 [Oncorhynchus keta]|uniref:cathepsin O isoform X4 n=1 Tax=Oncorhynchus keta TaxID=8018 RepID=UPI0015F8E456|nr:cathepsin O isoform X4 [Oncorhynchus keta]